MTFFTTLTKLLRILLGALKVNCGVAAAAIECSYETLLSRRLAPGGARKF
jgi:hypothetical protein